MPKIKTHKGLKKVLNVRKSGTVTIGRPGSRHNTGSKSQAVCPLPGGTGRIGGFSVPAESAGEHLDRYRILCSGQRNGADDRLGLPGSFVFRRRSGAGN